MIARKEMVLSCLCSGFLCLFLLEGCQHVGTKRDASVALERVHLYLVGMGPGDPDLATFRAVDIIRESDVIICSRSLKEKFSLVLYRKEVVSPPDGNWIWFGYGKKASDYEGEQLEKFLASEETRGQIIAKVRQAIKEGKRVAILDHGDPLIYGPWGWILEEFTDLRPSVVPGLSSFNAANAALKKGVTSGKHTKSVILTMPDLADMPERDTIEKLARHQATMVIFMPTVRNTKLKDLVSKISIYFPLQTPIALVMCAGYKEKERVIRGTLDNIVDKVGNESLPFEHLMYVGHFLAHEMKAVE